MTTILEDELSFIAPNVTIRVGTPPAYISTGVSDINNIPQLFFTIIDVASRGTLPVDQDYPANLVKIARKRNEKNEVNLLKFLIKSYAPAGQILLPRQPPVPPPPLPPSPFLLPPPPPPKNTTTGNREAIADISTAGPFEEINYAAQDLVGVAPPENPATTSPPASPGSPPSPPPAPPPPGSPPQPTPSNWTPLEISALPYFNDFPSAIYVPAINSCISTPYWAPEAKRHLNGVMGSVLNETDDTVYRWETDIIYDGNTGEPSSEYNNPRIQTRIDGSIILEPQLKSASKPYRDIYLEPEKWERKVDIKNGKTINAFSLILGIESGGDENQPQDPLWTIDIRFGEITMTLIERSSEISMMIGMGSGSTKKKKIKIKPTTDSYVTENFGERPYILTFIPVWNGILISHGVPASSDWGDTITYVPKDTSLDVKTQIDDILKSGSQSVVAANTKDRTGAKSGGPTQTKVVTSPFPPKLILTRPGINGKRYSAPGILMRGKKTYQIRKDGNRTYTAQSISDTNFNMGDTLTLTFHRCGGSFKFVPIWFTPYSKYHYLYPGAADPRDISKLAPTRRKKDPTGAKSGGPKKDTTMPTEPDVFDVKSYSNRLILPILAFNPREKLDLRTHVATINRSASKPISCISMEFRNVNPDVRIPIQVWGFVVGDQNNIDQSIEIIPPRNDESFLTVNDLPELRIRRFSISRGLDGANGEIVWDRNDPINGPLLRQPPRIGAIRVAIDGGANTFYNGQSTSGIVFTGLAMGNAQEDSPDENFIRIPLRGREAKIDAEGGIVLINPPIFDGWDQRDVMAILADYAGLPIDFSYVSPWRLITSVNPQNPVLNFQIGTSISQAMDTVTKQSSSLFFFDRFGTIFHIDAETSTGRNWFYPDVKLETFSDEPDYQTMRNEIIVLAQVAAPGALANLSLLTNIKYVIPTQLVMVRIPINTIPYFPWSRQGVSTLGPIIDMNEVLRYATRTAEGTARPRSTARCQIPPNANIDLFDTLNTSWIITSISHEADTQSKKWTMSLGVESFVRADELIGDVTAQALTKMQ